MACLHPCLSGSRFVHSTVNTLRVEFVIQGNNHLLQRNYSAVGDDVYLALLADFDVILDAHQVVLDRMRRIVSTIYLAYFDARFPQQKGKVLVIIGGQDSIGNHVSRKVSIPLCSPILEEAYALQRISSSVQWNDPLPSS